MRISTGLLPVLGLCVATASRASAQATFRLEHIRSYGAEDIRPGTERAGGPVLAAVVGVVQTSDSMVYVLDQKWQKIVAFRPDGRFSKVILGGDGEGPGEFRAPVHMVLSPAGLLAVLDFVLSRVTFFDGKSGKTTGQVTLQVASPLRLAMTGGLIWISKTVPAGRTGSPAIAFNQKGERADSLPQLSDDDRSYGGSVSLAVGGQGEVLLASTRPGLWDVWSNRRTVRRGAELFPGLKPPRLVQEDGYVTIGSAEAEIGGIAAMGPDHVLIRYRTQKIKTRPPFPDPATVRQFIGVFARDGSYLGSVELPGGRLMDSKYIYISPVTHHVFLSFFEPYPTVEEFRLIEGPHTAGE
jgi:6-bladed beta-propeller